ncbi:hypothetical protein BG000_005989 [Podila horticola]|nr:hypothetical protein BG000_005989 [Podila horticola]
MNKKVLSFLHNDLGVMIRCHDIKSHHSGILVTAEGTHSAVREHLYKVLQAKKLLSPSPACVLSFGQAEVLDPEEFRGLKLPRMSNLYDL